MGLQGRMLWKVWPELWTITVLKVSSLLHFVVVAVASAALGAVLDLELGFRCQS